MDFSYGTSFGVSAPEAYERLLLDGMRGDATLFTRDDEIEQAWEILDTTLKAWAPDAANPFADPSLWGILPAFLPVVLVLIAENVGHVKSVGLMIDRDLDPLTGRALLADGVSTVLAGLGGGSATTTYGENIGVMAATRVYSTAAYWVAGVIAILLGFSPKVGALIFSVPAGVLGGVTVALYGLIGLIGVKIWIDNKVDFSKPINQFTAAVALIVGIADFNLTIGDVVFNGIALGTIAAIVIYHVMSWIGKARGTHEVATPIPSETEGAGSSATP